MHKSVQKNHNKAGLKEKPFAPPLQQKKHRFHPINQDKIGTIIFQFHFTDPSQTQQTQQTQQTHRTYQTYPTYPTRKASVRFTTSRVKP